MPFVVILAGLPAGQDSLTAPPPGELRCLHAGYSYRPGETYRFAVRDGRLFEFVCIETYERQGARYRRIPRWYPLDRLAPAG